MLKHSVYNTWNRWGWRGGMRERQNDGESVPECRVQSEKECGIIYSSALQNQKVNSMSRLNVE